MQVTYTDMYIYELLIVVTSHERMSRDKGRSIYLIFAEPYNEYFR